MSNQRKSLAQELWFKTLLSNIIWPKTPKCSKIFCILDHKTKPHQLLKHFSKESYPSLELCELLFGPANLWGFQNYCFKIFLCDTVIVKFSKAEIELLHDFERLAPESKALLCELVKRMKQRTFGHIAPLPLDWKKHRLTAKYIEIEVN